MGCGAFFCAFCFDRALRHSDTGIDEVFMICPRFCRFARASLFALLPFSLLFTASAQGAKKTLPESPIADADTDHVKERAEWFLRGRVVSGKSAAELRHRAYQTKMEARASRLARARAARPDAPTPPSPLGWMPLGPVPLASDATGSGFQDYHQVSGRATAVAIDPADPSGNTVYIGGAQGGVWKSINSATSPANNVTWASVTDDQATLSIGSIVIQPGNSDPAKSVILVGTGEADNSGDSYFGLGILRSADAGNTWTLISTANAGALSFSGLGATRMAFITAIGQTNTVVVAMAATAEGVTDGALNSNTYRGLYTSTDAGQTWTYDALFSGATEATSATSVAYDAAAGMFYAALRYHGFYSSPDGLTWTRLANQPGASGVLSTTACPQNYSTGCPIYRGEITVVPGRNEMYVWFVSLDSSNNPVDQGIWQTSNAGAQWTQISDSGIINCGDLDGCGVEQAFYNLELLAVPNCPNGAQTCTGNPTDLYAGAINLYKCSINAGNPTCSTPAFMNLSHVYGCDPLGALAHVHPDQHALAFSIPNAGSSSASDLMYFANDGGIYRALDGFGFGSTAGSCSATNQFDDLNQNLGSMTQFVTFSQHPTNVDMLLGGTQDNGSPATATATTNPGWGNVLSGDGGYNAIDPNTGYWFASNPDTGSGTLNIQECSSGVNCNVGLFNAVVSSSDVGGDDGSFYFPYILDPQSTTSLLVGTCRVWRGPRSGGAYTALSLNFETFGTGTCTGSEVNVVRALAAGGPSDANGSKVIYATTDGLGPSGPTSPSGGHVWVTTNAEAVSGTSSTFADVTMNGPGGVSINPSQFPISGVAIDTSDPTGNTAYVTVMGFTGGPGHVWQTTNAGANWTDLTGTAANALPDSPANAVAVDPSTHIVYVGTDVGVFQSATSAATWTEVGPVPNPQGGSTGFLPNVAVTALALFNSSSQKLKLLRASTYGRGVWQYNLQPDFQIAVSNTPLTVFAGNTATFNGTLTALNGYNYPVALSCIAGAQNPPSPCIPNPVSLTPTSAGAAFALTADSSTIGDYNFNVQGAGSDPSNTTHLASLTLHVVNFGLTAPLPSTVSVTSGETSPPVSFQVTAQGSFNQSVTLSCSLSPSILGATCAFTPGAVVNPTSASPVNMTATVTVPPGTPSANYTVTLQATTSGAIPLTTSFTLAVALIPDFVFSELNSFPNVKVGSTGTSGPITISALDGFTGTVSLSCPLTFGANSCSISPSSVSSFPATATLVINGTSFVAGSYQIAVQGTSGSITHSYAVGFNVGDYSIAGPLTLSSPPGGQVRANLTFTSSYSYSGQINATCDATALPGAQCTLSPVNPITIGGGAVVAVTASINIPNAAPPGVYNINIKTQDAAGAPSHSWTMALTVQDFTLSLLTPASQTVAAGQSATYNFTVSPVGAAFANAVALSCSGIPSGAQCNFTPNPVTPGSTPAAVAMSISTSATTSPGTYTVTVLGTSGTLSHSRTASLTVAQGSFQLAISQPFPTSADAGSQQSAKVTLTPNYTGTVTASCDASALSGQCSITPGNPVQIVAGTLVTLTLTVNIPNSAAPNPSNPYTINVTVTDSSRQLSQTLTLPLTVIQDFTVGALTPSTTQTITAGQSSSYNFSVLPVGATFANAVNLSCPGPPDPACSFTPSTVTPGNSSAAVVLKITTTASSANLSQPPPGRAVLFNALWLALSGLALLGTRGRRRKRAKLALPASVLGLSLLAFLLPSCGGGTSNGGGISPQQGAPVTYTIAVTGASCTVTSSPCPSSDQLSHQAPSITLVVNP
jgi:uncharacterized membrane protein